MEPDAALRPPDSVDPSSLSSRRTSSREDMELLLQPQLLLLASLCFGLVSGAPIGGAEDKTGGFVLIFDLLLTVLVRFRNYSHQLCWLH